MNLEEVIAIHTAAAVKGTARGQGSTSWDFGTLPRSHLAFAGCSSAGLMLGDFARLQEALHARRLLDRFGEDGLVAGRMGAFASVVVAVDDNGTIVHEALL